MSDSEDPNYDPRISGRPVRKAKGQLPGKAAGAKAPGTRRARNGTFLPSEMSPGTEALDVSALVRREHEALDKLRTALEAHCASLSNPQFNQCVFLRCVWQLESRGTCAL